MEMTCAPSSILKQNAAVRETVNYEPAEMEMTCTPSGILKEKPIVHETRNYESSDETITADAKTKSLINSAKTHETSNIQSIGSSCSSGLCNDVTLAREPVSCSRQMGVCAAPQFHEQQTAVPYLNAMSLLKSTSVPPTTDISHYIPKPLGRRKSILSTKTNSSDERKTVNNEDRTVQFSTELFVQEISRVSCMGESKLSASNDSEYVASIHLAPDNGAAPHCVQEPETVASVSHNATLADTVSLGENATEYRSASIDHRAIKSLSYDNNENCFVGSAALIPDTEVHSTSSGVKRPSFDGDGDAARKVLLLTSVDSGIRNIPVAVPTQYSLSSTSQDQTVSREQGTTLESVGEPQISGIPLDVLSVETGEAVATSVDETPRDAARQPQSDLSVPVGTMAQPPSIKEELDSSHEFLSNVTVCLVDSDNSSSSLNLSNEGEIVPMKTSTDSEIISNTFLPTYTPLHASIEKDMKIENISCVGKDSSMSHNVSMNISRNVCNNAQTNSLSTSTRSFVSLKEAVENCKKLWGANVLKQSAEGGENIHETELSESNFSSNNRTASCIMSLVSRLPADSDQANFLTKQMPSEKSVNLDAIVSVLQESVTDSGTNTSGIPTTLVCGINKEFVGTDSLTMNLNKNRSEQEYKSRHHSPNKENVATNNLVEQVRDKTLINKVQNRVSMNPNKFLRGAKNSSVEASTGRALASCPMCSTEETTHLSVER